ncbi:sugar ABC transporter substrate-binding protein [Paenibacillus sp. MSJ-34]|uniref:ABC transporter substrate-binding protein n=1 Tax=Paenibacillus sp. MSJ-34 TaxID=2841529 RepID=UPI001C0F9C92|nr:sugar ABC transporter substrate-binding protein [Paenibacillus sp. MSJ-34]MBU5444644.1 sugar ABC transporter substrate-binding protein [Paenibacillus sp. MSJ-34]
MKRSRFQSIGLILIAFVLVLGGCSPSGGSPVKPENGAEAPAGDERSAGSTDVKLTVATVNNPDMVVMQKMTKEFERETGIKVEFVVLPENDLRKKVTEDVALGAGMFDIVTISNYDTPIWAQNGWIEPLSPYLDKMSAEQREQYDIEDVFEMIRKALSHNDQLYSLPFYAESSMLYYNTEMLEKAGVTMPENPTWDEVADIAKQVKAANNVPGIVLRGLPGWGEMMAPLNTVINAFGGRWYDMEWNAQLNSPETTEAVEFYTNLIKEAGQPGAFSTGFTEALTLMSTGKAAMWYDATVAAGFLNDEKSSQVAGNIGYALAPSRKKDNTGWLYAWCLAIESASKHKEEAMKFVAWATSKQYIEKVGESEGWGVVPPGTRHSTYDNPKYKEAAPFSEIVLKSLESADYDQPTVDPVPYKGIQFVAIPEFQQLGTEVSQEIAAALSGQKTVEEALKLAQQKAEQVAKDGGYKK